MDPIPTGEAAPAPTVLIVEDEALIGLDMVRTVRRHGLNVIGPVTTEAEALERIDAARPAIAFLDVNLGGDTTSLGIADRLQSLGVPFAFLTGYAASARDLDARFPGVRRLSKPCPPGTLSSVADELLAGPPS